MRESTLQSEASYHELTHPWSANESESVTARPSRFTHYAVRDRIEGGVQSKAENKSRVPSTKLRLLSPRHGGAEREKNAY